MKKENYQKRVRKTSSSVKPNTLTEKRFNKGKFRKETVESIQQEMETKTRENIRFSKSKKVKVAEEMYQFQEAPIHTFYAILTKNSEQKKGYSLLSKGSCVKVEEFSNSPFIRISTTDGRIGIGYKANTKRVFQ